MTVWASMLAMTTVTDALLITADNALRTLLAPHHAARPTPGAASGQRSEAAPLSPEERRLSGALMRVNHVGEICAQALYTGQALAARLGPGDARTRERTARHLEAAAQDETDHLAWCQQRLDELGDRRPPRARCPSRPRNPCSSRHPGRRSRSPSIPYDCLQNDTSTAS